MDRNEKIRDNSEYESLHKPVLVDEGLKSIQIVMPIVVFVLIIAVMLVYVGVQEKSTVEHAEQVTNQMAEYIADNIANEMDYAKSSIRFVASNVSSSMTSDTLENPSAVIAPMVVNSPFDDIEYIRADGMNVMNIGEAFDASDRVYYIEGMKGKTGIWNNFHPKTSKETLMNFYTPIEYEEEIVGVLTGYIAATTQLSPLFETKLYGEDIYGFLVDENDMIICSTFETEFIPDLSMDMFMDQFGLNEEQKEMVRSTIGNAGVVASTHKEPAGSGRLCVVRIPDTEWKVAVYVPEDSVRAIARENTSDAVITMLIISLILICFVTYVLLKGLQRRQEITKENEKLEEENRVFNEENKRAFKEISAIRDIIASANMGTWRIELIDGKDPCMYVDKTMQDILGISGQGMTPQQIYKHWFENIMEQAMPSVLASVEKMKKGAFDENTYLWKHPTKGERYVRCGGTSQKVYGGYILSGYHYDVDDAVREDMAEVVMLENALDEKNDYYNILGKIAGIYNSLHVVDLAEDKAREFSASKEVHRIADHEQGAIEMMKQTMTALPVEEYVERALEFTDLTTIAERMRDKEHVSAQLVGKNLGWFLASFITMETDEDGKPTKVIFTTQSIDEAKKKEESLIHKSRTDELTGLMNRRAYEEDIYEVNNVPTDENFVSMALDVNRLKMVNDTLGHAAGDELLIGASACMEKCFGPYGRLYRTGGDEFIAILCCDDVKLKEVLEHFEETMKGWKGELVDSLTVSYGYVTAREEPKMTVRELGVIADKRMYEAKSEFYKKTGFDRRGTSGIRM
ncbi:MAG: sensor domain-containing diguanylate cyclase [Lachnospiraceae bacterium]|nr:sensor domain-containing diguanylate cyclase [Lachnospiraceae bacterium]